MDSTKIIEECLLLVEKYIEKTLDKKIKITYSENTDKISIHNIMDIVSKVSGISINDMKNKNRKPKIHDARRVAIYLSLKYTSKSLNNIGKYFGNRDHATIIHTRKIVNELIECDDKIIMDLINKSEIMIDEYIKNTL